MQEATGDRDGPGGETSTAGRPSGPALVVVCGLPGAGKTTVAEGVADRVGGELFRTDVVRKDLRPDPEYTERETRAVYRELLRRARAPLRAGGTAVLDGTFRDREYRRRARAVARTVDAAFELVRVECPEAVARDRIRARRDDASDADVAVHAQFREAFDPLELAHLTVDNGGSPAETRRQLDRAF